MTSRTTKLFSSRPTENVPSVQVTVLHEDLPAGLRAKAFMDSLGSGMDLPRKVDLEFWRFDWLSEPSLTSIAVNRAKTSAMVLFSARSRESLPADVESWIREWLESKKGEPAAFVVLLSGDRDDSNGGQRTLTSLRRAAETAGVAFSCEFSDGSIAGAPARPERIARGRVQRATLPAATSLPGCVGESVLRA